MSTLYELDEHLQLLLEARADLASDVEVGTSADWGDLLEKKQLLAECESDIARYTESMLAKVDGTAAVIRNLATVAETCKAEAQRIARRGKQAEADAEYLKALVLSLMEQRDAKKLKGKFSTFTAAGNGGKHPLEIRQPELVPETFQAVDVRLPLSVWVMIASNHSIRDSACHVAVPEPNRLAIRESLERGNAVPGCVLGDRGKHLKIT